MQNLPSSEGGVLPIAAAGAMPETHYSIDQLLEQVVAQNASDLHVTAGTAPILRLKGQLCRMEGYPILSPEDTRQLLYRVMSTEQQKQLEIDRQVDMAHSIPGLARFRVNVYYQRGALGAAFRLIPQEIKTLEELGIPSSLHVLAKKPRGLVLVTGPTGSGKSTTLAALIDEINRTRQEHILTIEDPIEFVHRHKRCVVNQREVGHDANGVRRGAARRAAPGPRRDPPRRDARPRDDRDRADRGRDRPPRLRDPAHAERAVDDRPHHRRVPGRAAGAGADAALQTLEGVVTQTLLPTADGRGRVPALEILLPDDAVRNLIRQAKVEQIYSVMQTNTGRGHADDGAVARRPRHAPGRHEGDGALALEPARPAEGLLERAGFEAARGGRAAGRCAWRGNSDGRRDLDLEEGDSPSGASARRRRTRRPWRSWWTPDAESATEDLDLEEGALVRPQEGEPRRRAPPEVVAEAPAPVAEQTPPQRRAGRAADAPAPLAPAPPRLRRAPEPAPTLPFANESPARHSGSSSRPSRLRRRRSSAPAPRRSSRSSRRTRPARTSCARARTSFPSDAPVRQPAGRPAPAPPVPAGRPACSRPRTCPRRCPASTRRSPAAELPEVKPERRPSGGRSSRLGQAEAPEGAEAEEAEGREPPGPRKRRRQTEPF